MLRIFKTISNWPRRRRLLKKLHSNKLNEVVEAIYVILEDSKFYIGPKTEFHGGAKSVKSIPQGVIHQWTVDRERAYTVIKILAYLENKELAFPFYNINGPSIVHAMILAIEKFGCFERLSYRQFVKFYNRKGLAKIGTPDLAIRLPEYNVILNGGIKTPDISID